MALYSTSETRCKSFLLNIFTMPNVSFMMNRLHDGIHDVGGKYVNELRERFSNYGAIEPHLYMKENS